MIAIPFEIEEHVAEHNNFFKQTAFTLDDLDAYAEPLGNAARAVYDCSEGWVTEEQVIDVVQQAVSRLKAIHAAMDLENAA